jgi:hypothetical protein
VFNGVLVFSVSIVALRHPAALTCSKNKEVARVLGLRAGTVKCHVHNILQTLGETRRYSLIAQLQGRAIVLVLVWVLFHF